MFHNDSTCYQLSSPFEATDLPIKSETQKTGTFLDDLEMAGQRMAPVGAYDDDYLKWDHEQYPIDNNDNQFDVSFDELNCSSNEDVLKQKLHEMEKDQEELSGSLMSLMSHFAKVQFRLQQVVGAPDEKRDELLKDLEQFAFRGVPNLGASKLNIDTSDGKESSMGTETEKQPDLTDEIVESQKRKHAELINKLRMQLEELESYAYASGEGDVPSTLILERQKVVMEQLKARLNLNVDNIETLSSDELRAQVDGAVGEMVGHLKMKSHLVDQLQTQIDDLEKFIVFIQSDSTVDIKPDSNSCGCDSHGSHSNASKPSLKCKARSKPDREEVRKQAMSKLNKAMEVLQMATVAQFGCGSEHFIKNSMKGKEKGSLFGELCTQLDLAVDHVIDGCSHLAENKTSPESNAYLARLTSIVRKELAVALRNLLNHGLLSANRGPSMPFMGCMSGRTVDKTDGSNITHAWNIIMKYYQMKQGKEYNATPAIKLSQSFGLELAGNGSSTKQSFLEAVGQILKIHQPYKRSNDAHFKAFVCLGLNQKKLIPWLRLVVRNQSILETYYAPWSFVVKTSFDDVFKILDRLTNYAFNLPINVAVKRLQNVGEAF